MKKQVTVLFTAIACSAIGIHAQVTTSAIGGKITDENKDAVIGATITAIHVPSGTLYGAVTNIDGRYNIQGMRTGGPYKIEVSYVGYNKVTYDNIFLELGNTFNINSILQPSSELLDEVVVVADGKKNAGAAQNFNVGKIQSVPTINRNVYDIIKNMPMAMTSKNGGITFAGSNNRYNSFQIDGTVSNDVFGLAASGTNGGQSGTNPISMDAIQEIQVVIAPFDVRQSGFTGGGINAITKQGTNKFQASAYTYYTNQDMYGKYNANKDWAEAKLNEQSTKTFGATLGGAFIKNKLFYFVSIEKKMKEYPTTIFPGYTDKYLTADMAKEVADHYYDVTGIRESYDPRKVKTESLGLLARLDWNINEKHKFALRYQLNDSFDENYSPGNTSYFFANSGYRMNNKTNSFVAELNSRFSPSLFNEFRASATFVRDNRGVAYQGPTVLIKSGADNNYVTMNLGTEYSSGANYLNQNIYTLEDNLSWYKGNHTFTFGTHNELYNMQNLFIQASNGSWYFNSISDFIKNNPYQFTYKYTDPSLTGGDTKFAPTMKFAQLGFYAQDKWDITNNLNLTYGLRFDIPFALNSPTTNDKFNQYAAEKNLGVKVGEMPSTKLMVSPRIGFRWYTDDSHNTLLRGGLGLFTGRVPFVWISNAYTNNGMEQKGTTISKGTIPGFTKENVNNLLAAASNGGSLSPDIVVTNKDFRFPQVFRTNLALEQMLPGDVKMVLEGVYSKTLNNIFFENLALTPNGKKYVVPGVEASAVPNYNVAKDYYSIINTKNTNEGYSYALSASLQKSFKFGLDLSASYTYGRSYSVNDGTSSVAYSNWKYNYSIDTNSKGELGISRFDIPHRLNVNVSYTTPKYLNGLMQTNIALVYNGYSGSRYSLTMNEGTDFNNDGYRGNNLLYIPTAEELGKMNFVATTDKNGNVLVSAEDNRKKFAEWIENDSYASKHRGQFAERNSNMTPWENQFDLHIGQDIFYMKERGSKIQITFDIENFANLLNKKWGANYSAPYNLSPLAVSLPKGKTEYEYTYNNNNAPTPSDIFSRWHAQLGLRVTF